MATFKAHLFYKYIIINLFSPSLTFVVLGIMFQIGFSSRWFSNVYLNVKRKKYYVIVIDLNNGETNQPAFIIFNVVTGSVRET